MVGIVVVGHGRLAAEMLQTLEGVLGPIHGLEAIVTSYDDRPECIRTRIEAAVRKWRFAHGGTFPGSLQEVVDAILSLGYPVLFAASRKSYLGALLADRDGTPRPVHEREAATLATTVLAVEAGVWGIRVHDVRASVDAIKVWEATWRARSR